MIVKGNVNDVYLKLSFNSKFKVIDIIKNKFTLNKIELYSKQ